MEFIHKLKEVKKALSEDLDPKYILSTLQDFEVISQAEYDLINSKERKQERFDELFSLMTNGSRSPDQNRLFVKALEEEEEGGVQRYPWLADLLKSSLILSDNVRTILMKGNVPLPANHLLPQEKKIQEIRNKLKEISDPANQHKWVVVHGPIGSGKRTLAAEALRSNKLINECFPNGVFWLDFSDNKINYEGILKLLDENFRFSSGDNFTDLLRNALKPKMLFILDDVSDESIIEAFNVGCPILVTTRLESVMDKFSSHCYKIESPKLKFGEIKSLLAKYVNCKPEELPKVVDEICKKCGGSVLVTILIGGTVAVVGNDEKTWKYWNDKLEESGFDGIKKFEERNVFKIILDCIQHIDSWKEYYYDLVIFKKGIPVPNEVLQIMWDEPDKPPVPCTNIAHELYKRSFVEIKKFESASKFVCCAHDLYLEAVCKNLGTKKIKELHKKFITKIMQIGRLPDKTFDLTKLPKSYIPTYIDYHLYQADELKMLEELYLDLKFVEQKIRLKGDYVSILEDYQCYRNCFENINDAETFECFLRRKGKCILDEKKCDIIQLALFEPKNSIVYKKAAEYARKNKGMNYDWCNEEENVHKFFDYEIKSFANVTLGAINQDASLVVVVDEFDSEECASEHTSWIKAWHIPSGSEFEQENSHSAAINYCAFSSQGEFLATASSDATVKVFKIRESFPTSKSLKEPFQDTELGDMILTFTEHKNEVMCCSFSSDDRYIISTDTFGRTLVWEFDASADGSKPIVSFDKTLSVEKKTYFFSSFSNNDRMIGTAVHDTLKLWNFHLDGTREKKWPAKSFKGSIRKFFFTKDDSHILLVQDCAILQWDIEADEEKLIFSDQSCAISSCSLSASGKYIACGMKSGSVIIITAEQKLKFLPGHNEEILNLMFSKDETKLFSVSPTRCIVHNVSGIENIPLINGNLSVVKGDELVVAAPVSPSLIEIRKGQMITESHLRDEKISYFALSNDGSEIIVGTELGSVKVFDVTNNECVEEFHEHSRKITFILQSKYDNSFFTCSEDATIKIWRKIPQHLTLSGHKQTVAMCVEFNRCDKLLSCSADGSLRVWNTDSRECICVLEGYDNENITCCDISRNDALISAGFANGHIKVWRQKYWKFNSLQFFPETKDPFEIVTCCQFSGRGDILYAGLDNGDIVLCRLLGDQTCEVLDDLKHESAVCSIRMSMEDGRDKPAFLSASKNINLWDRHRHLMQTIVFPNSTMGDEHPRIWASDNFDIFVVTLNSILYILKKMS